MLSGKRDGCKGLWGFGLQVCMSGVVETIPIKQLLMVTEMAAEKCKPGKFKSTEDAHAN